MFRWLKEPLFHFLLIGAILFVSYSVFDDSDEYNDNRIVIKQSDLNVLLANFTRTWQRPPTDQEMNGLLQNWIREEIAYREALALGLDEQDTYIKRRLRMKMELILGDIGKMNPPTEQELTEYLEQNSDKFWREPEFGFSQVFFEVKPTRQVIEQTVALLANDGANPEQYGDAIMLPGYVSLSPLSMIDRQFGDGFAAQLENLETGSWQGPVQSGFGFHLVMVHTRQAGTHPDLQDIRAVVEREFMAEREDQLKEKTYTRLREKYEIVVEPEDAADAT
jgi:hypothetical protein